MAEMKKAVSSGPVTRSVKAMSTASQKRPTRSLATQTVRKGIGKQVKLSKSPSAHCTDGNTTMSGPVPETVESPRSDSPGPCEGPETTIEPLETDTDGPLPNQSDLVQEQPTPLDRPNISTPLTDTEPAHTTTAREAVEEACNLPNLSLEMSENQDVDCQMECDEPASHNADNAENGTSGEWQTKSRKPFDHRVDKILILKTRVSMELREFVPKLQLFLTSNTHVTNFNVFKLERGDFQVIFKNNTAKMIATKVLQDDDSFCTIVPRKLNSSRSKWLESKQKFEVLVHNVPKQMEALISEKYTQCFRKGRNLILTFDSQDLASNLCQLGLFIDSSYFRVSPFTFPPKEFRVPKELCKSCLNNHDGECNNEPRCIVCNINHKTVDCPKKAEASQRKFLSYREALLNQKDPLQTATQTRPRESITNPPENHKIFRGESYEKRSHEEPLNHQAIVELINQTIASTLQAVVPVIIREVLNTIGANNVGNQSHSDTYDDSSFRVQNLDPPIEIDDDYETDPDWPFNDPEYPFDMDVNDSDKENKSPESHEYSNDLDKQKRQINNIVPAGESREILRPLNATDPTARIILSPPRPISSQRRVIPSKSSYKEAIQSLKQKARASKANSSERSSRPRSTLPISEEDCTPDTPKNKPIKRKMRAADLRSPANSSKVQKLIELIEMMGSSSDDEENDIRVTESESEIPRTTRPAPRRRLIKMADLSPSRRQNHSPKHL